MIIAKLSAEEEAMGAGYVSGMLMRGKNRELQVNEKMAMTSCG